MTCKICGQSTNLAFKKKVLNKYDVGYFVCPNCSFVQTEDPHWLAESYESAITSLDLGIVYRNFRLAPVVHAIISKFFNADGKFLDFGGGYGMFVRLMRDKGFDFYRQDKYCENLFALNYDVTDLDPQPRFDVVTAFEVFEHLPEPFAGIDEMLRYGDSILFSTQLVPTQSDISKWDYLVPEVGQHVALYSEASLKHVARARGLNFYTNHYDIHLLTRTKLSQGTFKMLTNPRIAPVYNRLFSRRQTLLEKDYNAAKARISKTTV